MPLVVRGALAGPRVPRLDAVPEMKTMRITTAALALLAASCAGMHGHDHEVAWVDFGPDPMMNPEFLAASMASATPGAAHAELAKGVGHYRVEGVHWTSPDAAPVPMTATADVEMILGGRYMLEHFHSEFMGEPFEGMLLMGFDNLAGEYWSLWIDNSSTVGMLSTGTEVSDGRIVMTGLARDPMTPKGRPMRLETVQGADGAFTMRMFDSTPDGREWKVMEMTYRR
jgi:hypothetical protein